MNSLIKSEFYKLKKSKSFKVMLIVAMIMGIIAIVTVVGMQSMVTDMDAETIKKIDESSEYQVGISNYAGVSMEEYEDMTAIDSLENVFSGNSLILLMVIFSSLFIILDFNSGSIKQIVSKGFTRYKILGAKFIALIFANILILLSSYIMQFIVGSIVLGIGDIPSNFVGSLLGLLAMQIFYIISYTSLIYMICLIFRSTALGIIVNIVLLSLGGLLFALADFIFDGKYNISQYWIGNLSAELSSFSIPGDDIIRICITLVVTLAIFSTGAIAVFNKRDIK